jgi:ATP-dependent DNA ligase
MLYPWPFGVDESLLDRSLKIAMDYLEWTGQVESYEEARKRVALTILAAYREGARHPIRLGNSGYALSRIQSRWGNSYPSIRVFPRQLSHIFRRSPGERSRQRAARIRRRSPTMSRKSTLPKRLQPMLATLTDARFDDRGWIFEDKYDGFRMIRSFRWLRPGLREAGA